jgi:membrane protein DedA with SNARE-associated domain
MTELAAINIVDISNIGWLNDLTNLFITIGENHKYLNFFIGMLLESAGIPFASMPAFASTSYLLSEGKFNFWSAVLVGGLGNAIGSSIAYFIGFFFGKAIRKRRKNHKLTEKEDRLQEYIKKHGVKTIFLAQLFGFTRVFISLPAGLLRMNFKKFIIATFLGGMIFVIYFALGMIYLIDLYDKFVYPYIGLSFISLGILIGFGYVITHFSFHFGRRAHQKLMTKNGKDN